MVSRADRQCEVAIVGVAAPQRRIGDDRAPRELRRRRGRCIRQLQRAAARLVGSSPQTEHVGAAARVDPDARRVAGLGSVLAGRRDRHVMRVEERALREREPAQVDAVVGRVAAVGDRQHAVAKAGIGSDRGEPRVDARRWAERLRVRLGDPQGARPGAPSGMGTAVRADDRDRFARGGHQEVLEGELVVRPAALREHAPRAGRCVLLEVEHPVERARRPGAGHASVERALPADVQSPAIGFEGEASADAEHVCVDGGRIGPRDSAVLRSPEYEAPDTLFGVTEQDQAEQRTIRGPDQRLLARTHGLDRASLGAARDGDEAHGLAVSRLCGDRNGTRPQASAREGHVHVP